MTTVPGKTDGRGESAVLGLAGWLSFAASPTFALMAFMTWLSGGDMMCSGMSDMSPLTGMTPMYLVMGAFHLTPWLKFLSGQER